MENTIISHDEVHFKCIAQYVHFLQNENLKKNKSDHSILKTHSKTIF